MTPIEVTKTLADRANKVYQDNWETKTRFAEHECKWTEDIQHRNHAAIEELSTTVRHLSFALGDALKRIDELEAIANKK